MLTPLDQLRQHDEAVARLQASGNLLTWLVAIGPAALADIEYIARLDLRGSLLQRVSVAAVEMTELLSAGSR